MPKQSHAGRIGLIRSGGGARVAHQAAVPGAIVRLLPVNAESAETARSLLPDAALINLFSPGTKSRADAED